MNDEQGYEIINFITKNNQEIKIGDKIFCTCEYEVTELRPVWHNDTKKHFKEHRHNRFLCKMKVSSTCLIHSDLVIESVNEK